MQNHSDFDGRLSKTLLFQHPAMAEGERHL
jgi:hypothetical protein